MPPRPSSHTPETSRQVIRISPLAYIGCAFLLFAVSFPVLGWPAGFGWLLIAPVVACVWVARVRTTVTEEGLELRYLLRSRTLAWEQIAGFDFPNRGWASAVLTDGEEKVKLPVVTFDRLPEISAASRGRVPDPYAAEAEAHRIESDETEPGETKPDESDR
ncbi:MAG: PH domain-containing protein [Rhodococcus sp.]|nr:PH domain-containing protein [Rhodococcus sp. (in: high G+C Gram-positive bacteria)]